MQGPQIKNIISFLDLHLDQLLSAQLTGCGAKSSFVAAALMGVKSRNDMRSW